MEQGKAWRRGLGSIAAAATLALLPSGVDAFLVSAPTPSLAARHEHKGKGHGNGHGPSARSRQKSHGTSKNKGTKPKRNRDKKDRTSAPQEMPALDPSVGSVFDLSSLRAAEVVWAQETLSQECSFDWDELGGHMGDRRVHVELGDPPARGMYYPAEYRLEVHKYYFQHEPAVAARVLAWEAAHVVDLMSLTDTQRGRIQALYHDGHSDSHGWFSGRYAEQVGEAFMEGFVAAYCPGLAAESVFTHETTPAIATEIKDILG